jgi:tetratricopeptide (TPR) repeat protein
LPQLVGRREARDGLLRRLASTISGRGGCAVLGGESGVGKTFLAKALVAVARSKMQVVVGECVPVGAQARGQAIHSSPLHPLRPLLQAINDLCVEGGAQATERLLGERAKILADYEPSLRELPGVAEMPEPTEVSAEAALRRLLGALTETLAALSEERPLLLVLDDVQWADGLTLDFLASLPPDFFEQRSLFLLCTYRTEEVTPALRAWLKQPWVEDVRLDRLQRESLGEMVSEMLAVEDPPDPLIDFLDQRSKGNPFFVAEYLRAAVTQGLLSRHEGEWLVHQGQEYGALALPDALHELILLRLGGLNEQTRALLEALAVLGREVELVVVERLTGGRGLDALGELFERQILEQQREFRWRVKFAHDKLREHTYEAIEPARRAPLHRQAALLLEACYEQNEPELALRYAELAFHWQQAGEPGQAVHYFEKAGEQALRHSAYADAVGLLSEALELHRRLGHAEPLRLARIGRQMGDAYMGMQLHREATERLYGAVAALGWPIPRPGVGMVGAFVREIAWQALQRARGVNALQLSLTDPRFVEGTHAYVRLQAGARAMGDAPMILYTALKALNLAERGGDIAVLAEGYALASVILGSVPLGTQRWAARYDEMSMEALQRTDDPKARCAVFTFRGLNATFDGRVVQGGEFLQEACRVAKLRGDLRGYEDALSALAVNRMILGDVRAFWTAGQELLASVQRGVPRYRCWGLLFCATAAVRLGRFDEAERLLQQEADIQNLDRALLERVSRCTTQALLDARRGRWDAVVESFDRCADDIDTIKPMILEFIYLMPRLLDALGLTLAALPTPDPRRPRLLARYRWTVRWLKTSGRTYKVAAVYAKVYEGLEAALLRKPSAPKLLSVALEQAEACQMRYAASMACLALAHLLPPQADAHTDRARALLAHASPQDLVPPWPLAL